MKNSSLSPLVALSGSCAPSVRTSSEILQVTPTAPLGRCGALSASHHNKHVATRHILHLLVQQTNDGRIVTMGIREPHPRSARLIYLSINFATYTHTHVRLSSCTQHGTSCTCNLFFLAHSTTCTSSLPLPMPTSLRICDRAFAFGS